MEGIRLDTVVKLMGGRTHGLIRRHISIDSARPRRILVIGKLTLRPHERLHRRRIRGRGKFRRCPHFIRIRLLKGQRNKLLWAHINRIRQPHGIDLSKQGSVVGVALRTALLRLQKEVYIIGDVRGMGLMLGVEFVDPTGDRDIMGHPQPSGEIAARVQHMCFENRLVMEKGGRNGSVMRCLCALNVTDEEIDTMLSIFSKVVREIDGDVASR